MRNCMSHTHGKAVLVVCVPVPTKFRSICLEQLIWWEDAYTTSLLGPVSHSIQSGHFNSVLLCQLAMSCTSVPRLSIQHPTGVAGSLVSSIIFSSRLTAGNGGNSRLVLFLEGQFSGLQDLSPVLACNHKKWLLWRLTLDFLATTEAVWIENIMLPSFQVEWQIVPPCPMPLSDQKIESFTPHDVSLGAKRNTKSL